MWPYPFSCTLLSTWFLQVAFPFLSSLPLGRQPVGKVGLRLTPELSNQLGTISCRSGYGRTSNWSMEQLVWLTTVLHSL